MYYSAFFYAQQYPKEVNQKRYRNNVDLLHPSVLKSMPDRHHENYFHQALRLFYKNKKSEAIKLLAKIEKKDPLYAEGRYLSAIAHLLSKKDDQALLDLKDCVIGIKYKKKTSWKAEDDFEYLRSRCLLQMAEISFKLADYKSVEKYLNYIKKQHYLWPETLLMNAWSFYWRGEPQRAIGSVMTYEAPLLLSYMPVESTYLKALVYYELCYFQKADQALELFDQIMPQRKKYLAANNAKSIYNMLVSKKSNDDFIHHLRRSMKFYRYQVAMKMIDKELKKLNKLKKVKKFRKLKKYVLAAKQSIDNDLLEYLALYRKATYTAIDRIQKQVAKLKLRVSLNKRKQLRKKGTVKFDNKIVSVPLEKIISDKEKFIWNFQGGFWADELGDYAVAIKDKCE
jgi:hypothetical protein